MNVRKSSLVVALGGLAAACVGLGSWVSVAAAAPETPVALPASAITGDSALLHGELSPGGAGEAGEYVFFYAPSAESCGPEGLTPEPFGVALGNPKEAVQAQASNLEPGVTYSVCLVQFAAGEAESSPIMFKTLDVSAPYLFPGSTVATGVSPFAATLQATVNPEKEATSYSFEIATNEALTENARTIAGAEPLPAVFGGQTASVPSGALTPETTYYFQVTATNGTGTIKGPIEHFATLAKAAPEVLGETVSEVNSLEPKFAARINPKYEETRYEYELATNEAFTENVRAIAGGTLPAGSGEVAVGPVGLTGLQPGAAYYYRVIATNATGTTDGDGEVHSFVAKGVPVATTDPAGAVTRTTVTIAGSVIVQGLPSTYHFAYIPLAAYEAAVARGLTDPFAVGLGGRETYDTKLAYLQAGHELSFEDYAPHPVALRLEELAPETTYAYALVAHNELGTTTGAPQTFTTQAKAPPLAVTGATTPPSATPDLSAIFPAPPAIAPISHATIAELDAREAKEGKATNPGKKKTKKKRKSKKKLRSKRQKRGSQGQSSTVERPSRSRVERGSGR